MPVLNKKYMNKVRPNEKVGSKFKRRRKALEEVSSDSEIDSDAVDNDHVISDDDVETAEEKRLRLAKEYIAEIEAKEAERREEADLDHDVIAQRLRQDQSEKAGTLRRAIADQYTEPAVTSIRTLPRVHSLSLTCAVVSSDNVTAFSADKRGLIVKWCLLNNRKVCTLGKVKEGGGNDQQIGHTSSVLALALSSDGKFLASGDVNSNVYIWEAVSCQRLRSFSGHRDQVTSLAFRKNSHQLFSGSYDRHIRVWDLDEMAFVEPLFGHEDGIVAIDSLVRERVVSVGRDRRVLLFKVPEESALKFALHGQADTVALLNELNFVTGGKNNSLCLWSVMKKNPVFELKDAHGERGLGSHPHYWITSVACVPFSDIVASGSFDGYIRFWKCPDGRSLSPLFTVPMVGFVNQLRFSSDGSFILAAVGQEHRMGRWWRMKEARNRLHVIPLPKAVNSMGLAT